MINRPQRPTAKVGRLFSVPDPRRRLVFYLDLWEFSPDRCLDRRVFRLSAGASKSIAGVGSIFDRIAPGFWKYKIAFRQIFTFRGREFCHSYPSRTFNSYPCSPVGWPALARSCTSYQASRGAQGRTGRRLLPVFPGHGFYEDAVDGDRCYQHGCVMAVPA